VIVTTLGRLDYRAALALQAAARDRVLAGGPDECLVLEHDPVVTLGRRGGVVDHAALERLQTPVIATDRGGLATWHGPGQLVAYPIVDTGRARLPVPELVRCLGLAMVAIALHLGLPDLDYDDARPGVYRAGRKLGSIGLHLTRGVTTHGLALNIVNSLDGFRAIEPCGFGDLTVSTVARELDREVRFEDAVDAARVVLGALPGPWPD